MECGTGGVTSSCTASIWYVISKQAMNMKRNGLIYIVLLILTSGCATSCQHSGLPVVTDAVAIGFRSAIDNEGWIDRQPGNGRHADADSYSRGTLASVLYDSFGCWAGAYNADGQWTGSSPMNLMYHREIKKAERYDTHAYWPGAGKKVRFFAYAPYALPALVLPDHVTGNPKLVYTVPAEITAQQDLLIAWTGAYDGDYNQPVDLKFRHALTAIRFIDYDLPEGVVTGITLGGVYSKASLTLGADGQEVWSGREIRRDFTVELNYRTSSVPESAAVINPSGEYFFMIPQAMEDPVTLTVRIRSLDGTETAYTTSLKGTGDWEMGKVANYRLRINNDILVVVESLGDWQDGGSL